MALSGESGSVPATYTDTVQKNRFRGRVRVLSRDRGKRGPDRRPARQANNDTVSIVRTSVDRPVIRAEPTRGLFTHTRPARAEMSIESN